MSRSLAQRATARRLGRVLTALSLVAVGLGAGIGVDLTAHVNRASTTTVLATTVEVISGARSAGAFPDPIPSVLEGATNPHQVVLASTVPADANLDSADYVEGRPEQLIVTWDRAHLTPNGQAAVWERRGIAIWQLDSGNAARWHRVYTFENAITNAPNVAMGFEVTTGDISGDGRPEVLVFFDTDGSAGSGTYHLFANTGYQLRQPLMQKLSMDQGTVSITRGALRISQGLEYRGPGIHCCFRKVRITLLRWTGHRLVTTQQTVRRNNRGWPPG
jgi:hypothetical protein